MPVPHPSFLYGESTEPPSRPLPLEARHVHFFWSPLISSPHNVIAYPYEDACRLNAAYAFRHDMIHGGRRAQTALETRIDLYVQNMMRKEGMLEGWWPRIEYSRGHGNCFNVVFLRPNMFGCTSEVTVAASSTKLNMVRWESEPRTGRWDPLPESEMAREGLPQQGDEAPEPVPTLEESLENGESLSEDTNSDGDSDNVPPTAHTEREILIQRSARLYHHLQILRT